MIPRAHTLAVLLSLLALPASAQEATESGDGTSSAGIGDTATGEATTEGFVEPAMPGNGTGMGLLARPFFVGLGLGFDAGLSGGGGAVFAMEEDIGYRFFGFNIGGALDGAIWAGLAFGQSYASNFAGLQFDVRGGVDFEAFDDGSVQVLVTPSITLGGSVSILSNQPIVTGGTTTVTFGFFDLGFAAQAEVVLLDGLLGIWLRPLGFEIAIGNASGAAYELLAGVHFRL